MRTLMFCTLVLFFAGTGLLSVHPHEGHSDAHRMDALPLAEHLVTFQELLETDLEAARAELQNVAEKLFEGHILAEEWVPLFFRISRDGTKEVSDVKRFHALEIRMLTSIDAEKYAKQIQQHQEALKHFTELEDAFGNVPLDTPIPAGPQGTSEKSLKKASSIAHKTFFQLVADNPEAAIAVLDIFALLSFDNHPLTGKWKELFFQFGRDKEATYPEALRFFELNKQMLTDNDPKKHREEIRRLEGTIKQMKRVQKMLERDGRSGEKIPFDIAPE